MDRETIANMIRRDRKLAIKETLKVSSFMCGFFGGLVCLFYLFYPGLPFMEKLKVILGIPIFIGLLVLVVNWIALFRMRHYNPRKFTVELGLVEDTYHYEDNDNHYESYSITVNGHRYSCSCRTYSRAKRGNYYYIVYSGRKKRKSSRILYVFEA